MAVLKRAGIGRAMLLTGIAACGEVLDTEESPPIPSAPADGGQTTTTPPSAADGGGGAGDDGSAPKKCTELVIPVKADTCLASCAGSISYGIAGFCNISNDALMLLRFVLTDLEANALAAGRIETMTLTLADHRNCDGCGNGISPSAGNITAHVAIDGWVEGSEMTGYSGADKCRRNNGNPGSGWGTAAQASQNPATTIATPADYSAQVGNAAITGPNDRSLVVTLNPEQVKVARSTYAPNSKDVSFILRKGASGGFVAATRESGLDKPKLTLKICD